MSSPTNDIAGAWLLREAATENPGTGERRLPLGGDPKGALLFHADGRMAMIASGGEALPGPPSDLAAPSGALFSYSGAYRIDPPNILTTKIDVAWLPEWVGSEQACRLRIEGDTLEIVSDPVAAPGRTGEKIVLRSKWTRETPEARTIPVEKLNASNDE
jgi:hypothetical protein